jgi:hypothetical protein
MSKLFQLIAFFAVWSFGSISSADEIRSGDSLESVIAILGPPPGEVEVGNRTLLYYERGRVELESNRVVDVDLISQAEADARRLKQQAAAERAQKEAAARRAQMKAEGEAVLEKKLSDPSFLASPPRYRLEYWEQFMRNYPDVPIQTEYRTAFSEVRAEEAARQAEEDHARQMAAMQRQLQEAEQRAYQAQDRASYNPIYVYQPPVIVTQPSPPASRDYDGPYFIYSTPSPADRHHKRFHHDRSRQDHRAFDDHRPNRSHDFMKQRPLPLSRLPSVDEWPKVPTPHLDRPKKHEPQRHHPRHADDKH